jgi:uncharacterized protein (TIGR03437 family)
MNRPTFLQYPMPAAALFALWPAFAQTTTPINIVNVSGTIAQAPIVRPVSLSGTGTLTPLGSAAVTFSGSQDQRTGLIQGTFTFFLNRLDSFTVSATPQSVGKMTTLSLSGPITGGTGAFSGATGSLNYTFKFTANTSSSGAFTLTGSGNIAVGQTKTAITQLSFNGAAFVASATSGTFQASPTGSVSPFGKVTVNFSGMGNQRGTTAPIQGALTFVFNANDSFTASFSTAFAFNSPSTSLPCTITGGTGEFSGATGSLAADFTLGPDDTTFTLTGSGSITQPPPGTPIITAVATAYAGPDIAQNTYIVVTGTNLVPANTPAIGVIWSSAPSFASGLLPTQLGGVSVTVDNKPAFVYFYCSAATDPACLQDQLNILTPLDTTIGPVPVVLTSGTVSIPPFTVNMQAVAPSFLLFTAKGYIAARHADKDSTLVGPASLYPGSSTPAKAGETISLYAAGFGLPATALVNGSSSQSGALPVLPVCQVGGVPAVVAFAGVVGPGLYQLNLTIPATAATGDNTVGCTYNGQTTPAGNLITVQ